MKKTNSAILKNARKSLDESPKITKLVSFEKNVDNFEELVRYERKYLQDNYDSCEKIYKKMLFFIDNKKVYGSLLVSAKLYVSNRIRNLYNRLEKSIGNISFCHDGNFSFLYIFIGTVPKIAKNTYYFYLHLDPEEDMSKYYIKCDFKMAETTKQSFEFQNFETLKRCISNYIIDNHF